MEPGHILALAFAVGMVVWRYAIKWSTEERKDEQERRQQLKLQEVEQAMQKADAMLRQKMTYYSRMTDQGRKKFLARLRVVLATRSFVTKEGLALTPEVQVLAASAFVQVTFGLDNFRLDRFSKIIIYPDTFYNKLLDRHLKGSTSPSGVVRFSWKHLSHGYQVGDDNINLAIHEVAHALKVSIDKEDRAIDTHLDSELNEFLESGSELRTAILEGKMNLLRKYASVNEDEFFACCTEYFFESPEEFSKKLPHLYERMTQILNQDPLRPFTDYRLIVSPRRRFEAGMSIAKAPFYASVDAPAYRWVQWIIGIGLFIGFATLSYMSSLVESSWITLLLFYATIITIGFVLYFRKFLISGYMDRMSFTFFLLAGWFPVVTSVALTLNHLAPVYKWEVVDRVAGTTYNEDSHNYVLVVEGISESASVNDGLEIEHGQVRWVEYRVPNLLVRTRLHYGIFGLKVYSGFELEEL